jgi:hypothetical protein
MENVKVVLVVEPVAAVITGVPGDVPGITALDAAE